MINAKKGSHGHDNGSSSISSGQQQERRQQQRQLQRRLQQRRLGMMMTITVTTLTLKMMSLMMAMFFYLFLYISSFFSRMCHRVYVSCFVGRSPKMNSTCPAYIFPFCEKKNHAILKLPNKTTRNRIQPLYGSHAQKIV